VVPLYFAKERDVIVRGDALLSLEQPFVPLLCRPTRTLTHAATHVHWEGERRLLTEPDGFEES
jgi:hypothetical protein